MRIICMIKHPNKTQFKRHLHWTRSRNARYDNCRITFRQVWELSAFSSCPRLMDATGVYWISFAYMHYSMIRAFRFNWGPIIIGCWWREAIYLHMYHASFPYMDRNMMCSYISAFRRTPNMDGPLTRPCGMHIWATAQFQVLIMFPSRWVMIKASYFGFCLLYFLIHFVVDTIFIIYVLENGQISLNVLY